MAKQIYWNGYDPIPQNRAKTKKTIGVKKTGVNGGKGKGNFGNKSENAKKEIEKHLPLSERICHLLNDAEYNRHLKELMEHD